MRWRPLSGISLRTGFGGVPLTAVMTFPELTDVVLGRSRRDFGSVLLVARGMPLRDGVKDDLGRERSHLSKVPITNHLAFNSLLRRERLGCLREVSAKTLQERPGFIERIADRACLAKLKRQRIFNHRKLLTLDMLRCESGGVLKRVL